MMMLMQNLLKGFNFYDVHYYSYITFPFLTTFQIGESDI